MRYLYDEIQTDRQTDRPKKWGKVRQQNLNPPTIQYTPLL